MISRYYRFVADRLGYYAWGRILLAHLRRHERAYGTAEAVFVALFFVVLIKTFGVDAYEIPSPSMTETLRVDDRIFVNKFIYRLREVAVGDIVVFKVPRDIPRYDPDKPYYIKRVVGLPGDTVEIGNDGYIYRNGKPLHTPDIFANNYYYWQLTDEPHEFERVEVPPGQVLVFGDNSADSYDSRYWGPLPLENILGKAFFRYWPVYPWRVGVIRDHAPSPRSIIP